MQNPNNAPVDISITLGSNVDLPLLADVHVYLELGKESVLKFREERKIQESFGDVVLCMDYDVEPGREKEFCQYVEKGMDGNQKHLSPLQQVFFRPKSSGKVEISEFPGKVRILYRIYQEYLEDFTTFGQAIEKEKDFYPVINLNFCLRGKVTHHKKNRTAVKVQYASVKGFASLNLQSMVNIVQMILTQNEEDSEFSDLLKNPLVKCGINMKKIKVRFGLESFRKLRRFYKKAKCSEDDMQKKTSFPYVTKGLIKDKAIISIIFRDQYVIHAEVKYHSEDIFMRLLKVYTNTILKVLQIAQNFGEEKMDIGVNLQPQVNDLNLQQNYSDPDSQSGSDQDYDQDSDMY